MLSHYCKPIMSRTQVIALAFLLCSSVFAVHLILTLRVTSTHETAERDRAWDQLSGIAQTINAVLYNRPKIQTVSELIHMLSVNGAPKEADLIRTGRIRINPDLSKWHKFSLHLTDLAIADAVPLKTKTGMHYIIITFGNECVLCPCIPDDFSKDRCD
jgi:hypothetical protein